MTANRTPDKLRSMSVATDQLCKSIGNNCQLLGLSIPEMIEVATTAVMLTAARHGFAGQEREAIAVVESFVHDKGDDIATAVIMERATKGGAIHRA